MYQLLLTLQMTPETQPYAALHTTITKEHYTKVEINYNHI